LKVVELKSDAVVIPSLKLLEANPVLYLFGLRKLGASTYRKGGSASGLF
jgi:hypothetical protein